MGLVSIVGRILIAVIFIGAGFNKIKDQRETAAFLSERYAVVHKVAEALFFAQTENKLPEIAHPDFIKLHSKEIIMATGVVELLGGILVILNSCFGASLLSMFLLSSIAIIHNPFVFNSTPQIQEQETVQALKNLAILGGLLLVGGGSAAKTQEKVQQKPVATKKQQQGKPKKE